MKKLIATILSVTVLLTAGIVPASADSTVLKENFETGVVGKAPEGFSCNAGGGEISVCEISGNKVLFNKIDNEGMFSTISKKFEGTENSVTVLSASLMQKNSMSNGTVLLAAYSEGKPVVKIVAKGSDILYEGKTENKNLVENCSPNVWYNIQISVNTADKTADVTIDGKLAGEKLALLSYAHRIDELRSYSCYSPGYYIDDIKIMLAREISVVTISGSEVAAVTGTETLYEYTAQVYDKLGNIIDGAVAAFELVNSVDGVVLAEENGKAVLKVSENAIGKTIYLKASYADEESVKVITVKRAAPSRLEINGALKIYGKNGKNTNFPYNGVIFDEAGGEVSGTLVWALSENISGVRINSDTGILTTEIQPECDTWITINVTNPESGITAQKKVLLLPENTYKADESRLITVKEVVDNILKYGTDPYRNTALIADGIEKATKRPALWRLTNGKQLAMSNLANQSNVMMSMDLLTLLTGDEAYRNRVNDIYTYYLKYLRSEINGLFYWGGHTTIDLQTGRKQGEGEFTTDGEIHEFKNHMPYLDPLFRLDSDETAEMLKTVWAAHVSDWSTLTFNRHGYYDQELNLNGWNNTGAYDNASVGKLIFSSGEMPFRNAANDLIYCAYKVFEYTKDQKALLWAERLLNRYNALADPETKIGVYQFIQPAMRHDPMLELEPIGRWNKVYPTPSGYDNSKYGDRAKNQFEQQFVDEGIITEDERWKIREAYWVANGGIYKDGPLQDFKLAELCGVESSEGQKILEAAIEGMASFVKLAYIPEKNQFRYLLSSGIDLTGYVLKTGGYYGDIGTVLTAANVDPAFIISYSKAYNMCGDKEEFKDEKKEIWSFLRGLAKANGLGDLGDSAPGVNARPDFNTTCSEPYVIIGLINLYKSTGNHDFIELARKVGNNIVQDKFDGEFFTTSSAKYVRFADSYTYVLLMLEAEIMGRSDKFSEFILCEPYFHCNIQMDNGWNRTKKFDREVFWPQTLSGVLVQSIKINTDYIELAPGDVYDLNMEILPDDAADKEIIWTSSDSAVAETDGNKIYAYSPGTAVIDAVSEDLNAKNRITVRVKGWKGANEE